MKTEFVDVEPHRIFMTASEYKERQSRAKRKRVDPTAAEVRAMAADFWRRSGVWPPKE